MREQAIAEYGAWLDADDSLNADLMVRLRTMMKANGLLYGERELGVALRPHLLTRTQYDTLACSAQVIAAVFERVSEALLVSPTLMESIGLNDAERRLAVVHPGFRSPAVTTRLDAFVYDDQVKFVEYNAENPSSLPDQAGLNKVLFELEALQKLARRYRLRQFYPVASVLKSLLRTYREWGGKGMPNIAILDWADLPTSHEFVLLRDYFMECGVPTAICTPQELEYAGGGLRAGDFPIDLVYKRVIINEFLERCGESHPLVQAYIRGDICLVNPFRCKLLHKKATFEILTAEENQNWFSAQERSVIRRTIPWTRRVTERKTMRWDSSVDLVNHVRKCRSDFVLKPNDDYGGRGIFIGNRMSQGEWEGAVDVALSGDYVVQERIELRAESFPVFDGNSWSWQPMFVDTNPFIFNGRVDGAMVRLSTSPVVNVTAGGGETGFFVIEPQTNH